MFVAVFTHAASRNCTAALILNIQQTYCTCHHTTHSRIFPQRRLLLVYGEYPMFHLMQKISTREDKYQICNVIHYEQGMEMIAGLIHNYDGVIIGDIPAHERNLILKRCFGEGIRTYTVPKISDVINRSSDDLNLFDTPLLLSRNEDFKIEQAFGKRMADLVFSAFGLLITSPFFIGYLNFQRVTAAFVDPCFYDV